MRHMTRTHLRHLSVIALLAVAVLGLLLWREALSPSALAGHRDGLLALRGAYPATSALVFVLAYAGIVALSLPGATLATLAGGMLFGLFPGVALNVAGASLGAVAVFLAVRAGVGFDVAARVEGAGGRGARLLQGFRANLWPALLAMRLFPGLPFFLCNLLPAFAGVRLWPFAATTVLGILPGAFALTTVGAGLGEVLAAGGSADFGALLSPGVILALLVLSLLAAAPILMASLRRQAGGGA